MLIMNVDCRRSIKEKGEGYVYTRKSGSDLNWIYIEKDTEVGRIADQNWIGSAISRVNARRIRTKIR